MVGGPDAAAAGAGFTAMPMVIASFLRAGHQPAHLRRADAQRRGGGFVDALLAMAGVQLAPLGPVWPKLRQLCLDRQLSGNNCPTPGSPPRWSIWANTWSASTVASAGCCRAAASLCCRPGALRRPDTDWPDAHLGSRRCPRPPPYDATDAALRRTVAWVAALNLALLRRRVRGGRAIGSVSLFADSIDFLEDTAVSLLVAAGAGLVGARAGMAMRAGAAAAGAKLPADAVDRVAKVPAAAAADARRYRWPRWALAVNLFCALLLLARARCHRGSGNLGRRGLSVGAQRRGGQRIAVLAGPPA